MDTTALQTDREIRPDRTVADLVVHHPHLRTRLEQLGVDYCCGGQRPLKEAVEAAGLEWGSAAAELSEALGRIGIREERDWDRAPLAELADHILGTHHVFMREQLPRLDALLAHVLNAHRAQHGAMLSELKRRFNDLRVELEDHLMKEELILFPAIKEMDRYASGGGEKPCIHCGSVEFPIRQMEAEHGSAGDALAAMRTITGGYTPPSDACEKFKALYDGLLAMEADLHEHIHLENNILFPKAIRQEAEAH